MVVVGVPPAAARSRRLDVGELVVVDDVVSDDGLDEVVVSDDEVDVELLVSDDVVVDVVEPGATTAGSGITGGGTPGGSVAFGSFASTFTVRSCH